MLTGPILIDTGPLVAIFNEDDADHQVCTSCLEQLRPPLLTCWPVLTEAAHLLRRDVRMVEQVLDSCVGGFLDLLPLDAADARPISEFLGKYRDARADLADAALMHLADREQIDFIFTLDRRDFSIYRTRRGKSLEILPDLSV